MSNEAITFYNFLAQDDYYVISSSGRKYVIIILVAHIILFFAFGHMAKKENKPITKKAILSAVIAAIAMLVALFLQFPAMY